MFLCVIVYIYFYVLCVCVLELTQLTAREISLGILWCALKRARLFLDGGKCLTAESVQSTALTLQGVDNVHGCHGLPLGVLGVGDGITDDIL